MNKLDQLNFHFENKNFITLEFDHDGYTHELQGIICKLSDEIICIAIASDWHFDGFAVLYVNQLVNIEFGVIEKFNYKILEIENEIEDFSSNLDWLDGENLFSVCSSLKKKNIYVQVEGLQPKVDNYAFGKFNKVENSNFELAAFDSTGLEQGDCIIPYAEVSVLKFSDEYSAVLSKYIRTSSKQ